MAVLTKIDNNIRRDAAHVADLQAKGWSVLTTWDCEPRNTAEVTQRLDSFLANQYT